MDDLTKKRYMFSNDVHRIRKHKDNLRSILKNVVDIVIS